MERYECAEAFLEVLNVNGIDTIFMNPGLDVAPIQTAIIRYMKAGKRVPKVVLCPHESLALSAAHGHYMVTGKPQVVLVHAELGTLQLGGSLINAQWGRAPIILFTGQQIEPERKTWKNQPYDQGSIVRNSVKREYVIQDTENLHTVLQTAIEAACSEPCGLVYLTHHIGYLHHQLDKVDVVPARKFVAPAIDSAAKEKLHDMATMLAQAGNPVIVAGFTGRYADSVEKLVALAETLCAPVLNGSQRMNFPANHPLFAGIEKNVGNMRPNPYLSEADVILAVDFDMQYAPAMDTPKPECRILHIGVDDKTQGRPLWGRETNLFIKADTREAIPALTGILSRQLNAERRTVLKERFRQLEKRHQKMREENGCRATGQANRKPISPEWLTYCVNQAIGEEAIVVSHLISHMEVFCEQITRSLPGTLLTCPGGSINWALGAAFGAKVGAPGKTVVSLCSDGGFIWGGPVATLWASIAYQAPFLSVIYNNKGYGVIKGLLEMKSGAQLTDQMAFDLGSQLTPTLDYAGIARSCGAFGRRVTDPDDVMPALKEGLQQVNSGTTAVLDVVL